MSKTLAIEQGKIYHIYNRGINSTNIFCHPDDYNYFLKLYEKFINPIADTFAWVLMPNHFHFSVRIKEDVYYKYSIKPPTNPTASKDLSAFEGGFVKGFEGEFDNVKWQTLQFSTDNIPINVDLLKNKKIPKAHLHFSHLFSTYSIYFNVKYKRHGSLFERPFKRKLIRDEYYFKQVLIYIHSNPIHHSFCKHLSIYHDYVSTNLCENQKEIISTYFENLENFKFVHNLRFDFENDAFFSEE